MQKAQGGWMVQHIEIQKVISPLNPSHAMPRLLKAMRVAPFIQLTTGHFSNAWTLSLTVPFTSTTTAGHLKLAQHGGPMPPALSLLEKDYQTISSLESQTS